MLKFLEEWATYGNLRYFDLRSKLKSVSVSELIARKVSWHRSCYQETVHTGLLKRAKDRYVIITFVNDGLVFISKLETKELNSF